MSFPQIVCLSTWINSHLPMTSTSSPSSISSPSISAPSTHDYLIWTNLIIYLPLIELSMNLVSFYVINILLDWMNTSCAFVIRPLQARIGFRKLLIALICRNSYGLSCVDYLTGITQWINSLQNTSWTLQEVAYQTIQTFSTISTIHFMSPLHNWWHSITFMHI